MLKATCKTEIRVCQHHGETTHALGRKRWRCRKCASASVIRRRKRTRDILTAERGGKCEACGYSRCMAALEWHHLDPTAKEFGISTGTVGIARLRAEVAKCRLLCSNCHREVHAGVLVLPAPAKGSHGLEPNQGA